MIARVLALLLALIPFTTQLEAGWWDSVTSYFKTSTTPPPPMIRVLIANDKPGVILEVRGKYKLYDPYLQEHISTRYSGKRKFIQATREGIKWGEEFPGVHQLEIIPDHSGTTTLVDGIQYLGKMFVYDIGGAISVVNQVSVEDYLKSLLSSQYRDPMPEEVRAAIAIMERTNAYYLISHPKNKFWDTDGTGYQGYAVTQQKNNAMIEAIQATRYMVMRRQVEDRSHAPFQGEWSGQEKPPINAAVISDVSLAQAIQMAEHGDHAAQILGKAFPGIVIQYSPE
jgi:stage II sporulation protein D